MDFVLSKEHEMARTLFRDFAQAEVKPLAQEVDETEHFPWDTVRKMQKLGFMGIPMPKEYGEQVLRDLVDFVKSRDGWVPAPDNYEGYRVTVPEADGWFLLRMSLHDPVMPLNIESNETGGVEKIKNALAEFFGRYDKLV